MATPSGQLIALQAFIALREAISYEVFKYEVLHVKFFMTFLDFLSSSCFPVLFSKQTFYIRGESEESIVHR